ncbi:hypothetical protein [Salipaludibacillus aurantiacus]|uniref:Uncharacterized protein n=1 Tax=Salipaludibacillus aurantiacus TaxID=1601833 RepID=A0A1H9VS13_9BACI|nr:hypothetical protein [Salipaludibacillus aurantiacus]SES24348.1 hypothetical protein SAMN05518684_11249 [Salipaludibacillus aurantiacus]
MLGTLGSAVAIVALTAGGMMLYSLYHGYGKKRIVVTLDNFYNNFTEQAHATALELKRQGKQAEYLGKGRFVVDEEVYVLHTRVIPIKPPAFVQKSVLVKKP